MHQGLVALTEQTTNILIGVVGVLVLVALLLAYRVWAPEPSLPRYRRWRVGLFVEHDRDREQREEM